MTDCATLSMLSIRYSKGPIITITLTTMLLFFYFKICISEYQAKDIINTHITTKKDIVKKKKYRICQNTFHLSSPIKLEFITHVVLYPYNVH